METNPHDRFARRAFADLDVMRAHLRGFLPPDVLARLDLARRRREPDVHLDPALRERLSDLLFSAPRIDGGRALVWFVFEHRSTPERFLPYDLLRSAARVIEAWRRANRRAAHLPWLVPVVLYAEVARVVVRHLDARDQETVMSEFRSTADVLREEGMAKGLESKAAEKLEDVFEA